MLRVLPQSPLLGGSPESEAVKPVFHSLLRRVSTRRAERETRSPNNNKKTSPEHWVSRARSLSLSLSSVCARV